MTLIRDTSHQEDAAAAAKMTDVQLCRWALESFVAWRDGDEGPDVLFREGARMSNRVQLALERIGR